MGAAIELQNLSKRYGAVQALDGVDLSVGEGEVFGFLGPNGAGKTTAIRILFDLIRPSGGSASVLGLDCQRDGPLAREAMGYLPGELRLYEGLKGGEIIDLFASLRPAPPDRQFLQELYERLTLDPSRPAGSYSRGNKQKLGLILAMMHRPRVLILDEPTSGLDPLIQEEVARLLLEHAAAGRTVFLSSHILPEVERMCHRVGFIRNGRIVAVEDVGELKGRALHLVEVTFAADVPPDEFDLPGIRVVRHDGSVVHFEVRSNLDGLLKAIARHKVEDLRTEQASLEDIFLAYYSEQPAVSQEVARP
ncbi:MAG TPA: ABC transporter ATP-binding protein [Dehalococcoidia bacterium]